jgi:tetratricopeptide (TPR) repeat protein
MKTTALMQWRAASISLGALCLLLATIAASSDPSEVTPRQVFNSGTRQLNDGKLPEAEAALERALASQNETIQPPALYNLGHVRFGLGVAELKKAPSGKAIATRSQLAGQEADEAIRVANEALASDDISKMVGAYMHGRGVRKELKAATAAVERALGVHGNALSKWRRASEDFKSALELARTDADAEHNAEVVDRSIARLVDSLREMQQCSKSMCDKGKELGEKLKQLKGRIPATDMPPGAAGEDEEEDESPMGKKPDEKEAPSRDGKEMPLSPELAGWLLQGFKLDTDRRLPMGQKEAEPKNSSRATW